MLKHKILSALIVVLGCMLGNSAMAQTEPSIVDGCYQITSFEELQWLRDQVNSGELSENLKAELLKDIKAGDDDFVSDFMTGGTYYRSSCKKWDPIGTEEHPFKGTFIGNDHKITGLFYNHDSISTDAGLFGYVSGGNISNLTMDCCGFKASWFSGGIAGRLMNNSVVNRCYSYGNGMLASADSVGSCTGGIAGYIDATSTVSNCAYDCNVGWADSATYCGGIAGMSDGTITSCLAIDINPYMMDKSNSSAICNQTQTVTNSYYDNSASYTGKTISDPVAIGVSTSDIKSGRICYLLNGSKTDTVWYQSIKNSSYPLPSRASVGDSIPVSKLECGLYVNPINAETGYYDKIILTDSIPYDGSETPTASSISYSRDINSDHKWHSICLPYGINSVDYFDMYSVKEMGVMSNDVSGYEFYVIYLQEVDTLPPGTPAFLRMKSGYTIKELSIDSDYDYTYTLSNEITSASIATNWKTGGTMTGGSLNISNQITYYLSSNALWSSIATTTTAPYRAYIAYTQPMSAPPARIGLIIDNFDVTGIEALDDDTDMEVPVYDLNGNVLTTLPKSSLYIKNNKKTISR
ncbi:MAG: hypothetical protein K6E86_02045 [Bacteroidales bacterium]|nr:hypothetical protein [Bacteroidales bacterium]